MEHDSRHCSFDGFTLSKAVVGTDEVERGDPVLSRVYVRSSFPSVYIQPLDQRDTPPFWVVER